MENHQKSFIAAFSATPGNDTALLLHCPSGSDNQGAFSDKAVACICHIKPLSFWFI
ncbi:MAG: hypothetical protein ACUVQ4_09700 [bacterium]